MESDVKVGRTHPDWVALGNAESSYVHGIVFALKHDKAKLRDLETIFWEVSNPQHKNYGKYLTYEETNRLMSAPREHIDIVQAYLDGFGVTYTINPQQDMITARVPVGTIEKMLNTKLGMFERPKDHQRLCRALQAYYLPAEVASAVDLVANLLDFPHWFHPKKVDDPAIIGSWTDYCGAGCHGWIVPQVMSQSTTLCKPHPVPRTVFLWPNSKVSITISPISILSQAPVAFLLPPLLTSLLQTPQPIAQLAAVSKLS
jgi:subtilase family serine protease